MINMFYIFLIIGLISVIIAGQQYLGSKKSEKKSPLIVPLLIVSMISFFILIILPSENATGNLVGKLEPMEQKIVDSVSEMIISKSAGGKVALLNPGNYSDLEDVSYPIVIENLKNQLSGKVDLKEIDLPLPDLSLFSEMEESELKQLRTLFLSNDPLASPSDGRLQYRFHPLNLKKIMTNHPDYEVFILPFRADMEVEYASYFTEKTKLVPTFIPTTPTIYLYTVSP